MLLSTTGISDQGHDIPIAMMPMYHWMLSVPHADKKKMEELMIRGEGKDRKWVIIRPSYLWDGEGKGLEKIRVSTETPGAPFEAQKLRMWPLAMSSIEKMLGCGLLRAV